MEKKATKFCVERLVYDGSVPSDDWIVKSIGHKKLNTKAIVKVPVCSMHEYEAGCKLHDSCLGHMGVSPSGVMIPIQSMSVHNVDMSNSVYRAVRALLHSHTSYAKVQYMDILRSSMKRKTGRMRKGILNCHVDGSLRMVITPQWTFPRNVMAIPSYLKGKWMVCRYDKEVDRYSSREVKEGDYAVVVRPPALSPRSVQPMVIRFWDKTCIGISPDIVKSFDGDYDGDEMHVNPVYSEDSIAECKSWRNTPNPTICRADIMYRSLSSMRASVESGSYILHTTMSFAQMTGSCETPLMCEDARMKTQHILQVAERISNPSKYRAIFDLESIRGMTDINRRYLTQPIVGDMSRIAKLAASCVYQLSCGSIGVASSTGFEVFSRCPRDSSGGNATMRAISVVCASAQQVALDAHRIAADLLPAHDMINDMIVGSHNTLVVVSSEGWRSRAVYTEEIPVWVYVSDESTYVISSPASFRIRESLAVLASYNPVILRYLKENERLQACKKSIILLTNYYRIPLSSVEIESLSVLYTYKVSASTFPITTREGMYKRQLRWTETTMARHYSGLASESNRHEIEACGLDTVSACLIGANFSQVILRERS